MELTILQASAFALNNLKTSSDLTVHSVYQKAVNLKANGQLLTLQPRGSVLSPISLITDCSEAELASIPFSTGKKLAIPLNTRSVSSQDLFLPLMNPDFAVSSQEYLRNKIREAITLAGQYGLPPHMRGMELILNQPELLADSLYMNAANQYLTQFHQIVQTSMDSSKMADCLCHLIGLGIGLTPSGDDFLCGFLAGLRMSVSTASYVTNTAPDQTPASTWRSAFLSLLEQNILKSLDRTNEISAAFLRCAVLGQFSAPVHLLADPDVTARQIYEAFSCVGHSSGIDTLCGVYTALEL